jgi:hypothetical protein
MKIRFVIFAMFSALFLSCQELPPEAYFIDKYKIQGEVYLDNSIKDQCKGALFIIVRKGTSPQPLAVKKSLNPHFPYKFTITPADVLMPDRAGEFEGEIILMARISKTGNPLPQKGDCESDVLMANAGDKNIKLLIKNIVK